MFGVDRDSLRRRRPFISSHSLILLLCVLGLPDFVLNFNWDQRSVSRARRPSRLYIYISLLSESFGNGSGVQVAGYVFDRRPPSMVAGHQSRYVRGVFSPMREMESAAGPVLSELCTIYKTAACTDFVGITRVYGAGNKPISRRLRFCGLSRPSWRPGHHGVYVL